MRYLLILSIVTCAASSLHGETIFIEAESFTSPSNGWVIVSNSETRKASRAKTLHGANGDGKAVATKRVTLKEAGSYRIWVRSIHVARWRGTFRAAVYQGEREIAGADFDAVADAKVPDWQYRWESFDADVPPGVIELRLSKHKQQNCVGYVRHVDCILLTTDKKLVPDYVPFGPQTYVRATLGAEYARPAYLHVFADHYRDPWYGHHTLDKEGCVDRIEPPADKMLRAGERTPWCNISRILYPDSGSILNVTVRHHYHDRPAKLRAKLEFATAPDDKAVVRTIDADCSPNGLVVIMPPDLTTEVNLSRFGRDKDYAERIGRQADAGTWPTIGRRPVKFPFFAAASFGGYGLAVDDAVTRRERKTLDYFGFVNDRRPHIGGGIWLMDNGSYSRPRLEDMKKLATEAAAKFRTAGKRPEDIAFCMLTDEPNGQDDALLAKDDASNERFRTWLKAVGKRPADLGVADWQDVKAVLASDRDKFPELHVFTQRFRTRSLGDFMATQRGVLKNAYGADFPTLVNFSDGAVYFANVYGLGIDYFELLDTPNQNAIWNEDWSSLASTYQCSTYNVELMRAAARKHGQTLGHYLIAYAGRKPWDVKLTAAGQVARGVKVLENFFYGVSWGSHEGGPAWASSAWHAKPETWRGNAEIVREIGGIEDILLPAKPVKSEVALLYSTSTDAWTLNRNHAHGFERMHTWLALAHAQVPIEVLSERDVESGLLTACKVCYLSGPNLSRAAAEKLKTWVSAGGVLWLTADAATRDEFNRPLATLNELRPARLGELTINDLLLYGGKLMTHLPIRDEVRVGQAGMPVVSVKQTVQAKDGTTILGKYRDGTPALVVGPHGKGRVYQAGFFPGLAYIYPALTAHKKASESKGGLNKPDQEILNRSDNPWQFPAGTRELLLVPVRDARPRLPIECDTPLVDAVLMESSVGAVIPLANYTLQPLPRIKLRVNLSRPVSRVESVHRGELKFTRRDPNLIEFELPLDSTDFVTLR